MNAPTVKVPPLESGLSDDELLSRLLRLVKQSRHVESVLVAHLAEVDERRLYVREGSSSLFTYCTDVLHLSEPVAQLRITAARASRRFPVILSMLEDGRLHLSAIGKLAKHLTVENHEDVLNRAAHKSKREVEELIAALAPKPDVRPSIRKVPERGTQKTEEPKKSVRQEPASKVDASSTESTSSGQSAPRERASESRQHRDEREKVEPLSPARYRVQFTASAELRDKLDRLAELMPGSDLASIIETAVTEKLDKLEAKRYGKVKKPRKELDDADTSPGRRGVSAPVARFVWKRDGGECTFVSKNGRRCTERRGLEFHHDEPFGLGGDRSADNIRLLCKAHNMYMAERDYGKEWMDRYRCSMNRVRERSPLLFTLSRESSAVDGAGTLGGAPSG